MNEVWAYAPDLGETDHGKVQVASDHGVFFTLTPEEARRLATELESCAQHAEETAL